jgi:hypothetical protein
MKELTMEDCSYTRDGKPSCLAMDEDEISVIIDSVVHPRRNEIEIFMESIGYKHKRTEVVIGDKIKLIFQEA